MTTFVKNKAKHNDLQTTTTRHRTTTNRTILLQHYTTYCSRISPYTDTNNYSLHRTKKTIMTAEQAITKGIEKCDDFIAVNKRLFEESNGVNERKTISTKLLCYAVIKQDLTAILNQIKNEQI